MTKSVFRPTRIKDGKRIRSRMYRLAYQFPGMRAKKLVSLNTSDKQVAERNANELMRELQQEQAGIIQPKRICEAAMKPLGEHLESFLQYLQSLDSVDTR